MNTFFLTQITNTAMQTKKHCTVLKKILYKGITSIILLIIIAISSCDSFLFYQEPIQYPQTFLFTGTVIDNDSVAIRGIEVVLFTPVSLDSVTGYTDVSGTYMFQRKMEHAGPNRMILRDIDGTDNGGYFKPIEQTFYLREEDWEGLVVRYDFMMQEQ